MKMHKEKNDLLILDTPTAVQVFLFLAYLVKLCKSDSFEGQSKETSKVATLSTTFFSDEKKLHITASLLCHEL